MRVAVMAAAISLALVGLASADDAKATIKKDTNIPAEGLAPALQALGKTYELQVLYRTEVVGDLRTGGALGTMTAPEAFRKVLSGTGLSFKYLDENTVTIIPVALSSAETPLQAAAGSPSTQDTNTPAKEGKSHSSSGFLMAQAASGQAPLPAPVEKSALAKRPVELQEVVVTAEKRTEPLLDVPVPVTALSGEPLLESNQLRIADYYSQVPSLTVTPDPFGGPQIAIRGITSGGFSNPTVGVVIDDVPFGSSTGLGGGQLVPDLDPSDLARIEVLRGPQGTLYGASSIGGLLKYVTIDPSTDGFSARLQAGTSNVFNGAQWGYNVRAAANIPVSDTVAIRVSAFSRLDPGYIDDPGLGLRGVNKGETYGGRFAALWRISGDWSLKISALLQHAVLDGSPYAYLQPGLADLQQAQTLGGLGGFTNYNQAYSATLHGKIGVADLVVISGYNINKHTDSADVSYAYGPLFGSIFGVPGVSSTDLYRTSKFTQELRLSLPLGSRVDWLLGGYYTDERNPDDVTNFYAVDPSTGQTVGLLGYGTFPTTFREYAAFTNVTVRFTDQFDVQVGGRASQIRQSFWSESGGPIYGGTTVVPTVSIGDHAATYLLTPRLKLNPELMVYARVASGYRPGGPNSNAALGVPPSYNPDRTENYEVGLKADALNHTLSFDASLYYIDWKDIQLLLISPIDGGIGYTSNAGSAKSEGVELSVTAQPISGFTVSAWVAFDNAVLTEGFPSTSLAYGASGDRLPNSPRFSSNLSLRDQFPLSQNLSGFIGGTFSYIGDRVGTFQGEAMGAPLPRQTYGGFGRLDLLGGVQWSSWKVDLFVNNVTDRRGVLVGGLDNVLAPPTAFDFIQPRTAGVNLVKTF